MALKPCRECKKEVAPSAKTCPHCGVANPALSSKANVARGFVALVLIGGLVWYFFGGGIDRQVENQMNDITAKVADDAVAQYNIAARSGTAIDRCVQAGMVSAAFLQAKNDAQYAQWKDVEKRDCQRAGLAP